MLHLVIQDQDLNNSREVSMKPKKEITEQDLELLERSINTTKIQLIDIRNQFNKSLGRMKGTLLLYFIILAIGLTIGYIIWYENKETKYKKNLKRLWKVYLKYLYCDYHHYWYYGIIYILYKSNPLYRWVLSCITSRVLYTWNFICRHTVLAIISIL